MTVKEYSDHENFPFFVDIPTRWMDSDVYGHVNNVEYYSYIDTAINMHLAKKVMLDPNTAPVFGVVAETGCKFFKEIRHPDIIEAGIRVTQIGNSSVTYQVALYRRSDEALAALGHFVHVYVDRETRKPRTIPDAFRKELNQLFT
tara:strand:+ start:99 stop:533 length:435 start_codon:yes stop_codon:yes gene_type:complete